MWLCNFDIFITHFGQALIDNGVQIIRFKNKFGSVLFFMAAVILANTKKAKRLISTLKKCLKEKIVEYGRRRFETWQLLSLMSGVLSQWSGKMVLIFQSITHRMRSKSP